MWNIMKGLNYQIKRDKTTIVTMLIALLLPFLILVIDERMTDFSKMTGSMYVTQGAGENYLFLLLVTLLLSTRISGWDHNDKTINYEILSGHKRLDTYFARAVISFFWSLVTYIVMMIVPVMLFTVLNGWGNSVSLKNVVIRYLLVLFPLFRIVSMFVLLTFILANCYKALVLGYMLFEVSIIMNMLLSEILEKKFTVQFTASNMEKLLSFTNYKPTYINGENVMVYQSILEHSLINNTMIVSLTVGISALLLGYLYFRKHDMN